ncbi:MAG: HAD family hydrolase [Beduini sp.]|uniref:HAD family hydrolase n=1 Tax=Beduini sp. TaxID=1922300 RepID=UPI0011CC50F1
MNTILFDLDGTLTDPALGITNAVSYALKHYGIDEDYQNLLRFIGPPLVDSFMEYYGFDQEKAQEAIVYYREYFSDKGMYENEVYDGMENLLAALKDEGYILAVATSKPEEFAKKILDHFHLSHYFTEICGATMDSSRSKKGDVIAYALNQLKISNPNTAIMVGDRQHDIVGAHQNQLKAIGVLYGYGNEAEMKEYQADYIAKDLKELMDILSAL